MTAARPPAFWLFPAGLALALGVSALPEQWPLYTLLAVGVAFFGLPHGSLDTAVAQRYLHLKNAYRVVGFFSGYLALGALVIAIWWQVPTMALSAFLLYSAVHFGDDVAPRLGRLGGLGYGLWLLAMPLTIRPDQVLPLFQALGATHAQYVIAAAPWALGVGGLLLTTAIARKRVHATSDWRDPLLFLFAAVLLHPLAYFVAYFCFLHSPRHLILAAQDLGLRGWREQFRAAAPTTVATYGLILAALPFLLGLSMDEVVLRLVFITLAALTVPHMMLELIASPRRSSLH